MKPTQGAPLSLVVLALVLACCGGDGDADPAPTPEETVTETVTEPAQEDTPTTEPDDSDDNGGTQAGAAGLPPRPARGECVYIDVAGDGRYTVYDAGTAVVRREGQRLVLGRTRAAAGWTATVDDRERREVEIEFRSDSGEELDLEVEIDDGRVKAEICADDD
jgi:hypothetical protein